MRLIGLVTECYLLGTAFAGEAFLLGDRVCNISSNSRWQLAGRKWEEEERLLAGAGTTEVHVATVLNPFSPPLLPSTTNSATTH